MFGVFEIRKDGRIKSFSTRRVVGLNPAGLSIRQIVGAELASLVSCVNQLIL